jgi:hypothetical protein
VNLTLDAVLTAGGVTASAALITGIIAVLKQVRGIGQVVTGNEPTTAFILSALLTAASFASIGVYTPEAAFVAVLAWFGIAQIAMGVHDTVKSLTMPAPVTVTATPPPSQTPLPRGSEPRP